MANQTAVTPFVDGAISFLRRSSLLVVWAFQYLAIVPAWAAWKITVWTFVTFGMAGLLIFIPIVGWGILYLRWKDRQEERRHTEMLTAVRPEMAPVKAPNRLLTPWLLSWW